MEHLQSYLAELRETMGRLPSHRILQVIDILEYARLERQQIFLLGNGGSAATASHLACDLSKGTLTLDQPRFRAVSLTDNMSLFSAWANDTAYEHVFEEQLDSLMYTGDVVIGMSCGGNSPNVLNAMRLARQRQAVTIGFTGSTGGVLEDVVEVCVVVPTPCMEQIEDLHLILGHLICTAIRDLETGAILFVGRVVNPGA
jgi:D-sedoheptulose 7-phosphate isomerase